MPKAVMAQQPPSPPPPISGGGGRCNALGGDCSTCLGLGPPDVSIECDWCQADGACYERGSRTCDFMDLRHFSAGSGGSILQICANQCTSQSCPVAQSECDVADSSKCVCSGDLRAEGIAGHATKCVASSGTASDPRIIAGQCVDTNSSFACDADILRHPLTGCSSSIGFNLMATYCKASCGIYCRDESNGCVAPEGVDYADLYCVPHTQREQCRDMSRVDFACPHHTIGKLIPFTCNDPSTSRDDNCSTVYLDWWDQCGGNSGQLQTIIGASTTQTAELQDFRNKCIAADAQVGGNGASTGGHRRRDQAIGGSCTSHDVNAVNAACCNDIEEDCSIGGVPRVCLEDCASVYLPFWSRCSQLYTGQMELQTLASQCNATATSLVGRCSSLDGGNCATCLHTPGCEWCELHARCYDVGANPCDEMDTRRRNNTCIDLICNNKCTSQLCSDPHSTCDPRDGQCYCDSGYRAEGESGSETICVSVTIENSFKIVASQCTNADSNYCGPSRLADTLFGCGSRVGYATMATYCQASCGSYCALNYGNCVESSSGVDYGENFCVPITGTSNCMDTTAIDYACPHHTFGNVVPLSCNNPRSHRDDQCANVYTQWYTLCNSTTPLRNLPQPMKTQLADFYQKCKVYANPPEQPEPEPAEIHCPGVYAGVDCGHGSCYLSNTTRLPTCHCDPDYYPREGEIECTYHLNCHGHGSFTGQYNANGQPVCTCNHPYAEDDCSRNTLPYCCGSYATCDGWTYCDCWTSCSCESSIMDRPSSGRCQ
jgi:hypothetical protein